MKFNSDHFVTLTKLLGIAMAVAGLQGCASSGTAVRVDGPALPAPRTIPYLGVNVGTHGPVPPWVLNLLAAQARPLVTRTPVLTLAQARAALDAQLDYPSIATILLVEGNDLALVADLAVLSSHPKLLAIELGNELDLAPHELTPAQFRDWTTAAYTMLRTSGFTKDIISGGIFSVEASDGGSWHAQQYLAPLLTWAPADLVIGVHWYGDTSDSWLRSFKALIGSHRAAVTEFGMPSRTPAEDAKQRAYLLDKRTAFEHLGVEYACVYAWASGATASDLDSFGLQRTDATLKPGIDVLR